MSSNGTQVLLIEDNPADARLIQEALTEVIDIRFDSHATSTLTEGISHLESSSSVDIILADLSLPDSHGLDTFYRLHRQFPKIPIVILTGLDDRELALKAVKEGAQDFIVKGDRRGDQMVRIIRYAIERNRLVNELEEKNQALQAAKLDLENTVAVRTKELQESEERFRSVYETAPLAFVVWDQDCLITDWNSKAEELFGWAAEEVLGRNFFEIIIPEEAQSQVKGVVETLLQGELPNRSINENITKNGEIIVCEWNNAILHDSEGKFVGVLSLALDITQRKEAEDALRKSEERAQAHLSFLETVMEQSSFAMWISDPSGTVIKTNNALRSTLNLEDEQIIGKYNVLNDGNLIEQGVMPQVQAVFEQLEPARFRIPWTGNRAGEVDFEEARNLWIDVAIFPILDSVGKLSNAVCQFIDVTEQVQAHKAIEDSHARMTTILDSIDADVYVSDMDTYEIIFTNQHLQGSFGDDIVGKTCWKIFRGESGPCPHCTNEQLLDSKGKPAGIVTWECQNPITKNWYINQDRAIKWVDGRYVRLQIATDITERKKAEQSIKESEEKFRLVTETIQDVFWMSTPGVTEMIYISPGYEKIWGRARESLYASPSSFIEGIHPDDLEQYLSVIENFHAQGKTYKCEYRIRSGGKTELWIQERGFPIIDEQGNVNLMTGICTDITERKLAEAALLESEARFRTSFHTSPDSININRLEDGLYVDINEGFTGITGFTREEVVGRTSTEVDIWVDPFDRQKLVEGLEKTGRVNNLEAEFRMKDGRVITGLMSARVIELDGKPHILSITRNISDLKAVESALLRNQAMLNASQALAKVGGWEWDVGREEMYWTEETYHIHGVSLDEVSPGSSEHIDKSVECYLPEDRPVILAAFQKCVETGEPYDLEFPIIDFQEQKKWIRTRGEAIRKGGEIVRVVGNIMDITEQKQAESELQKSNRALKMLSECNQAMIRAASEDELLHNICKNIIKFGGYRLAWVGFAEQDQEKNVYPAAQAGFEEGYLEGLQLTWADNERGRGPTGTAIRTGETTIARDILNDPQYAPWREQAHKRGYASSIAVPLITPKASPLSERGDSAQIFGALNIYAPEAEAFNEAEVELLEELADDLAYGITALWTTDALQESEAHFRSLIDTAQNYVLYRIVSDFDQPYHGRVQFVSPSIREVMGAENPYELSTWFTNIHPDDRKRVTEANTASMEKKQPFNQIMRIYHPEKKNWRWIHAISHPVTSREVHRVYFNGIILDITERLLAEQAVKHSREQLRALTNYLQSAIEDERAHISREIHDEFGQLLTGLKMDLSWLARKVDENSPLNERIQAMDKLTDQAITIMRRISSALRPGLLDDLGLLPALEWYTNEYDSRPNISASLSLPSEEADLDPALQTTLYRIYQEILTNVARHAQANKVTASLKVNPNELILKVKDDGIGISQAELQGTKSLGLLGMRERAAKWGGQVEITGKKGKGTTVRVQIPLPAVSPEDALSL